MRIGEYLYSYPRKSYEQRQRGFWQMVKKTPNEIQVFEIQVEGHLDAVRASEFGQMRLIRLPNGQTLISGQVVDQAALFGILLRIRDMGIKLVSVKRRSK
jgi:hypothetical protein